MKSHLLLGAVAMFAWASFSMAQEGQKGKQAATPSFRQLTALLQEPIDLSAFMNQLTLREFLLMLQDRFGDQGKQLPIIVDINAFRTDNPDAEDTYDTPVQFEKFPRQLPIRTALRLALSKVKTNDATYLIRQGHIEITTGNAAHPERLLREPVTARFDKRPLDEALDELSDLTGATIVLDGRAAEKAKTAVSADFKGTISLENAVHLLAALADLHADVHGSTLFITTKQKVEAAPQKGELHLRQRRLDLALTDLAHWAGVTIVLDPNVQIDPGIVMSLRMNRAEGVFLNFPLKTVTASFKPNVSPQAAVRIVASQADLGVAALDNAYYVTTHENAERLREERPKSKKEAGKEANAR